MTENEKIGPETRADDIKSNEFDRKNTGKSAGGLRLNELNDYPYLIAGSLLTLVFFLFIFSKITKKYTDRILQLPDEKNSVFMIMNLKGYLMFAFMITLGLVLKSIHSVPIEFFAFFYCGLGPALLYVAIKFSCKIKTLAQ